MADEWSRLNTILNDVIDLTRANAVLSWDQQTYMPPGGARARAEQQATLGRMAHERFASAEVGDLLAALEEGAGSGDSDERALLREVRRRYDQAVKVPASLVSEMARVTSAAMAAWSDARRQEQFALFQPHLERIVKLTREKADALGYDESPYDALLDQYEPGVKRSDINALFAELRGELVALIQQIVPRMDKVDDSVLRQDLEEERQMAFAHHVVQTLGFDYERGRMDLSEHPFTTTFSPADVRLTTRIARDDLRSVLYSAIHEAGHGMYEQGIPMRFARTALGVVPSLGFHESQSRLWENVIGRSRPFWQFFLPHLRETFPRAFDTIDVETLYRAVNRVEPTLIRTEADEVTYNLHVMLRYELEQSLITGDLSVADLPGVWDAKMEEYLTVKPPSVRDGVLQDVHWSHGLIGYFPTYTLGTVMSVQLYDAALADHPDIPGEMRQGNFETLRRWMQEKIYDQGSMYPPKELLHKITGTQIQSAPYLAYIKGKYSELYNL